MRGRISLGLTLLSLATFLSLSVVACSGGSYEDSDSGASGEGSATDGGTSGTGVGTDASGATTSGGSTSSDSATASGGTTGTSGTSAGDTDGGATSDTGEGTGTTDPTGTSGDTGTDTDTDTDTDTTTTGGDLCDDQSPVTLFLSPDDSNSMSSPVQVRASVFDGFAKLTAVPIRAWEFFNYYSFDYPPAPVGEVALTTELFRLEEAPAGEYVLQIGVTSETMTDADRAPMNITLVLDESGSMTGTPMNLLKESCKAIAASLKEGDNVSVVTWDTENAVRLAGYQVDGPDDPMLLAKIEDLTAGGGTDLNGGLTAGYQLAKAAYDPSGSTASSSSATAAPTSGSRAPI
ncbi:MAG: VWA domain-containing protein [Nannocystaceae bacterium]